MKRIICLFLALIMVFALCSCGASGGKTNENDVPKGWVAPDLSEKTTVGGMCYLAPDNWRKAEIAPSVGWYYYPYEENQDGMLFVSSTTLTGLSGNEDRDQVLDFFEVCFAGFVGDGTIESVELTKISGFPAAICHYRRDFVQDVEFGAKAYAVSTTQYLYIAMATEPQTLSPVFESCLDELVKSITIGNAEGWTEPDFSKATTVNGMQYLAPRNWSAKKAVSPDGWYYWPSTYAQLYIASNPEGLSKATLKDDKLMRSTFRGVVDGIVGEGELESVEYTEIDGYPAVIASCYKPMAGVEHEMKFCVIYTTKNNYCIMAGEPGMLTYQFEANMDELLDTISFVE